MTHRGTIALLNTEIDCLLARRRINDYRVVSYFAELCTDLRAHYRAAWQETR